MVSPAPTSPAYLPLMQLDEDLRALMAEPWGRRFAYWLIHNHLHLNDVMFPVPEIRVKSGDSAEQHQWRFDGARLKAFELDAKLKNLVPHYYALMLHEQADAWVQHQTARLSAAIATNQRKENEHG